MSLRVGLTIYAEVQSTEFMVQVGVQDTYV